MVKKNLSSRLTNQSISRRRFVGQTGAAALGATALGGLGNAHAQLQKIDFSDQAPLRERAKRSGFYYGAAVLARQLREDKAFRDAVIRECNALVHENELKWYPLQPREGMDYDFKNADYIADFADEHDMVVRGAPLVWYISIPNHVKDRVNKNTARDMLETHIKKVLGRYAGRFHSWDVVNEVLHQDHGRDDGLRNTFWLEAIGPEYIEMAFETASKVDPNTLLVFNDHAVTYDRDKHKRRRRHLINWVKRLQGNGIPIHGVGMQAHLSVARHPFDGDEFRRFLDELGELGMRVYATELDVNDRNAPADLSVRDQVVAEEYERFLEIFTTHPAVDMIVTWGLSDKYTWLNEYVPRLDGLPQRSLPLDHKMRRKESWHALATAFDQRTNVNEL